jgi:hypothetical protein
MEVIKSITENWILETNIKDRKTERQKDRKTERHKDRKKERQKDRKAEKSRKKSFKAKSIFQVSVRLSPLWQNGGYTVKAA